MMPFFGILCIMTLAHYILPITSSGRNNYCIDNVSLGMNYIKKDLATLDYFIYTLAVSHHTGNIYVVDWQSILYVIEPNVTEKNRLVIINCPVQTVAVDGRTPTLFVACANNLRTVDEKTFTLQHTFGINHRFWQLYAPRYTSDLYAVRYDTHEVYLYKYASGTLTEKDKLDFEINGDVRYQLTISGNGNYFYNEKKNGGNVVKILLKGTHVPISYSSQFLNLAVDSKGRVYGTSSNGLYRLNCNGSNPQFVSYLDFNPYHMYFDVYDNIVFGTYDQHIIMFKYNDVCFSSLLDSLV